MTGTLTIVSTAGGQVFNPITLAAGTTSIALNNVHPGWAITFKIASGLLFSAAVSVNVLGVSTAPYSGNPGIVPPPKVIASTTQTVNLQQVTTTPYVNGVAGIPTTDSTTLSSATVIKFTDGSSQTGSP